MKDFRFDHTKIKKKAEPKILVKNTKPASNKGYTQNPLLGKVKRVVKMDAEIGVYKILCIPTNSVYIGQSKGLTKRFKTHMDNLRMGRYQTTYPAFQNDYNHYGLDAFIFEAIENVEEYELLHMETHYIQVFLKDGFNVYNHMLETENVSMVMCSNVYAELIKKLVRQLESGKIRAEDIERGIYYSDNF